MEGTERLPEKVEAEKFDTDVREEKRAGTGETGPRFGDLKVERVGGADEKPHAAEIHFCFVRFNFEGDVFNFPVKANILDGNEGNASAEGNGDLAVVDLLGVASVGKLLLVAEGSQAQTEVGFDLSGAELVETIGFPPVNLESGVFVVDAYGAVFAVAEFVGETDLQAFEDSYLNEGGEGCSVAVHILDVVALDLAPAEAGSQV